MYNQGGYGGIASLDIVPMGNHHLSIFKFASLALPNISASW